MNKVTEYLNENMLFTQILLWLRELLAEHKIPCTLYTRLEAYIPELSKPVPDLKEINYRLNRDIDYLNSRQEFAYIREFGKLKSKKANHRIISKYTNIRILSYQDIIELDTFIDRVFTLEIHMDHYNDIFKKLIHDEKAFHYRLKLSTLTKGTVPNFSPSI